ncbi:P-type conjugative transfer protein TrbL, partial [Salmonella enterica subsp. enterica]|nr:P-type conjugative transfer protein TrbL [Salmonella enterica]
RVAEGAKAMKDRVAGFVADMAAPASGAGAAAAAASDSAAGASAPPASEPDWAKRLHRRQQIGHAASTAAHTLRAGDGGGSGSGPSLGHSGE